MYFLKKLVWLYAVHPWLIWRKKGWQLNYKVTKDTVINVQNLFCVTVIPCKVIHTEIQTFFAFGDWQSWSCMPSWDTQTQPFSGVNRPWEWGRAGQCSAGQSCAVLLAPELHLCALSTGSRSSGSSSPAEHLGDLLGIPAGAFSSQLHLAPRKNAPIALLQRENLPLFCLSSLETSRKTFLFYSIQAALAGELHSSRVFQEVLAGTSFHHGWLKNHFWKTIMEIEAKIYP